MKNVLKYMTAAHLVRLCCTSSTPNAAVMVAMLQGLAAKQAAKRIPAA